MIRRLVSPKTGKVTYQVDLYDPQGSRFRVTFKLRRDAEAIEARGKIAKQQGRWAEFIALANPVKITFPELAARYAAAQDHQKSWKSFKAKIIPILTQHFGGLHLQEITYYHLETYRQERLGISRTGRPRSPARVNRELAVLRHLLNKAVAWGLLFANPFAKGQSLRLPEPRGRLRYLTPEEIPRLLAECPAHLAPLVRLALHTGLRLNELLTLRWDQVANGYLYLEGADAKNHQARSVPLNAEALAALAEQRRRFGLASPRVFPYKDVRGGFQGACRRAGIRNFRFHDLRHTFASHLAMAGVPLATIAKLLGHHTLTMTLRYAHLSPGHLQDAVDKLTAPAPFPSGSPSSSTASKTK